MACSRSASVTERAAANSVSKANCCDSAGRRCGGATCRRSCRADESLRETCGDPAPV